MLIVSIFPSLAAFHYLLTLKTGTGWFAGTSAPVIIKIIGTNGDTGDIKLKRYTASILERHPKHLIGVCLVI